MRTAHSLTVSPYLVISHARPLLEQPCMPPLGATMPPPRATTHTPRATTHALQGATTHAPLEQPCMPALPQSNHACPPQSNHACPPGSNHACPTGATTHAPLSTEWQTGVKILPCPNFVAGGKNRLLNLQPKLHKVSSCLMRHKINSIQIVIVRVAVHCPSFPSTRGALNFTSVQQWCK